MMRACAAYRPRQGQVPAVRVHHRRGDRRSAGSPRKATRSIKLTRGVGDTWFHTADGRRWFRLDEQRHDVPIAEIAPHLQHAFVAVEDHRFFLHPGVDPIALGARGAPQRPRAGTRAGRQHADAAAGAHAVSVQSQELRPQGARSGARVPDRSAAQQAADPRAVPESDLPRRRHLRRRGDVATRVRQAGEDR